MKAETVFNVFEALPELEKQRLLKMVSGSKAAEKKVKTKKPIITDSEAKEIIYKHYSNFSKKWKKKMNS